MLFTMVTPVFALTPGELQANPDATGTTEIQSFGENIMGVLTTVGVVIAVVILIILGIKYMMGSASEKAEYKKTMIPYIIGAACIFLAPTIANMLYSFLKT
jgi:type IV secretory pathway VirB2 component (pilin)